MLQSHRAAICPAREGKALSEKPKPDSKVSKEHERNFQECTFS